MVNCVQLLEACTAAVFVQNTATGLDAVRPASVTLSVLSCGSEFRFSEAFDKSLQNSNLRTSPSDSEVLACSTDMMICFVHASDVIMHNDDNNNLHAFQLIVLAYLGTY